MKRGGRRAAHLLIAEGCVLKLILEEKLAFAEAASFVQRQRQARAVDAHVLRQDAQDPRAVVADGAVCIQHKRAAGSAWHGHVQFDGADRLPWNGHVDGLRAFDVRGAWVAARPTDVYAEGERRVLLHLAYVEHLRSGMLHTACCTLCMLSSAWCLLHAACNTWRMSTTRSHAPTAYAYARLLRQKGRTRNAPVLEPHATLDRSEWRASPVARLQSVTNGEARELAVVSTMKTPRSKCGMHERICETKTTPARGCAATGRMHSRASARLRMARRVRKWCAQGALCERVRAISCVSVCVPSHVYAV